MQRVRISMDDLRIVAAWIGHVTTTSSVEELEEVLAFVSTAPLPEIVARARMAGF